MNWRGSTTVKDRIFAALPYLLPLIDGLMFGIFLFRQFPVLAIILLPLTPILTIYGSLGGLGGLIVFFALFFLVVRNESISHFIRFNTMQAILLDIGLILCSWLFRLLGPALSVGFVAETLYNVVFLGMLIAVGYSVVKSLLGHYAEIPTISDAVHMQVR